MLSRRRRIAGFLAAALSATVLGMPAAFASDWSEANRASVERLNEGDYQGAARMAEQAADLYAAREGYRAESHLKLLFNLIDIQHHFVSVKDLPGVIRRAAMKLEAKTGEDHELLIHFWKLIAQRQTDAGEFADAKLSHTRIIYLAEKNHGTTSLPYVEALRDASLLYREIDGAGSARVFLTQAEEATAVLPEDHTLRSLVQFEMAKLFLENNDLSNAEERYQSVLTSTAKASNDLDLNLRRVSLGHLALIAKRRGDETKMEEFIQRTADLPYPAGEPQPLIRTQPELPPGAGLISRTGHVKVRFTLSGQGRVKDVEVLETSGSSQYASYVDRALADWRYQPRVVDGRPIDTPGIEMVFRYTIENDKPETGSRFRAR